jgi:hypothetical protein
MYVCLRLYDRDPFGAAAAAVPRRSVFATLSAARIVARSVLAAWPSKLAADAQLLRTASGVPTSGAGVADSHRIPPRIKSRGRLARVPAVMAGVRRSTAGR